jgi:hypothetical protein
VSAGAAVEPSCCGEGVDVGVGQGGVVSATGRRVIAAAVIEIGRLVGTADDSIAGRHA